MLRLASRLPYKKERQMLRCATFHLLMFALGSLLHDLLQSTRTNYSNLVSLAYCYRYVTEV